MSMAEHDRCPSPCSTADPDEVLRAAMALHRDNAPAQAEARYRDVLAMAPEHPDALHGLCVLLHATDRRTEARALIERSIALAPGFLDFYTRRAWVFG
jgi:Flp pilus assembly protein TadD